MPLNVLEASFSQDCSGCVLIGCVLVGEEVALTVLGRWDEGGG